MEQNHSVENKYPIVSFIGGIEEGKTSLIRALYKKSKERFLVSENVPGRGFMQFFVTELPPIIFSLNDKWISNKENIEMVRKSDTIVYLLPSKTFGYDEEITMLLEIKKINPLAHIIIACSKIDLLYTQHTSKKDFIESVLQTERTIIESYQHFIGKIALSDIVMVSCRKKWNVEILRERIWDNIIEKTNDDIFDSKIPTLVLSGKRGCGKSSTLNMLFNLDLPINMATACTKYPRVMHIETQYGSEKIAFNLVDLPGIAESINADMAYSTFYKKYIEKADVLLCLTQADTRAYLQDQIFYTQLVKKRLLSKSTNVLLGVNQVDLLFKTFDNPDGIDLNTLDENDSLLAEKIDDFFSIYKELFTGFKNISRENVIAFSAYHKWNIDKLYNSIINHLIKC